jgi:glycosyltransferase involved in cell wall biosynthesis
METGRLLIFCPDIDGHRQNYCYVIGSWFARHGYSVRLAASPRGTTPLKDEALLGAMDEQWGVELVEVDEAARKGEEVGGFVADVLRLERESRPTWTLFPAGEEMERPLLGLGEASSPESPHRAAVFVHMRHIYPPVRPPGISALRWMYHRYCRYPVRRHQINRWYHASVWPKLGLTMAFSPNGEFIGRYPCDRFFYLPDIYRAHGSQVKVDGSYISLLCSEYAHFMRQHPGKHVILYFGARQARRGYDELLHLAHSEKDTVFASCVRGGVGERFVHDVPALREALAQEGRIHEVETPFLPDNAFTDMLFSSTSFVLLPYPNYVGLSGVLLQALSYGKPVAVSDLGYMASLVKRNNIGLCFRNGDRNDFVRVYRTLCRMAPAYIERARLFARGHSQAAVDEHLAAAINQVWR